jgi:hypothetical protein
MVCSLCGLIVRRTPDDAGGTVLSAGEALSRFRRTPDDAGGTVLSAGEALSRLLAWSSGTTDGMAETEKDREDITSPDDPTHEATTPPGNGEADEEAVEKGEDKLDQAGGGH